MTRILAALCDRAGVRRVGWHTLRHTFASDLAMRGASASAIQRLLGHSTLAMTERYVHVGEAIGLLTTVDPPTAGTPRATPAASQPVAHAPAA